MNFLPIIALGAVAFAVTRKRRRRPSTKAVTNGNAANGNALPPANNGAPAANNGLGEVFSGKDPPDLITVSVGERFSVSLVEVAGTGYSWSLAASPPDNSVKLVEEKYEAFERPEMMAGGPAGIKYYVFEGAKPGKGALVFHHQAGWLEGKAPPAQVLEIQTIIS